MPKWGCDRIETQERFTHSHSHPFQSMVGYDCGHLFASVRHHYVIGVSPTCAKNLLQCHYPLNLGYTASYGRLWQMLMSGEAGVMRLIGRSAPFSCNL